MTKIFLILYAVIAYLISVVVTLYAIGFVGNLIVPKTIDSPCDTPWITAVIIDVLLISVFAIQHSVMARPGFKASITRFIHPSIERATYVLASSVALGLLCWLWQPINANIWTFSYPTIEFIFRAFFILGWLVVFLSSYMINHMELFGIKQVFDNYKNKPPEASSFQVRYFYKFVRHPLMLGFIIAFWSTHVMSAGHLLFAVLTTIYILVVVKYLEEKELRESIGKEYEKYQKEVPMILPF